VHPFRRLIGLLVTLAVLAGIAVGVDYAARYVTQSAVASAVKTHSHAQTVSVTISSFPFIYDVLAQGRVQRVDVVALGVPAGAVVLNRVELVADGVDLSRSDLFSGKPTLTSVSRATVTIDYQLSGVEAALAQGFDVQAAVSSGPTIVLTARNRVIDTIKLARVPLVPDCPLQETHTANFYQFTCTVSPVPPAVLATLSK
jgi:hypothetical protein